MDNEKPIPLRRSARLKNKSVSQSLNQSEISSHRMDKEKNGAHGTNEKMEELNWRTKTKPSSPRQQRSLPEEISIENKELDMGTLLNSTNCKQTNLKTKQNSKRFKRDEMMNQRIPHSLSFSTQYEEKIVTLNLLKTIRLEPNGPENENGIRFPDRFTDVAFLDESHVLVLDDKCQKLGQRVCCICLDGILVCDMILPGYPWSVIILSPTEAVISIRESAARDGLYWISVDIDQKSIKITRHLRLKTKPHGLSYVQRSEEILVSYVDQPFMSIFGRNGEELRRIRCEIGTHYRCLVAGNSDILFVDFFKSVVNIMDQEGNISWSSQVFGPICLETDCHGNIYVGSLRTGDLLKFDRCGGYLATFHCGLNLCGIGIDGKSERLITAQNDTLTIYKLGEYV